MGKKLKRKKIEMAEQIQWEGMVQLGVGSGRAGLVLAAAANAHANNATASTESLCDLLTLIAHMLAPYDAVKRYANGLEDDIEDIREDARQKATVGASYGEPGKLQRALALLSQADGMENILQELTDALETTPDQN